LTIKSIIAGTKIHRNENDLYVPKVGSTE